MEKETLSRTLVLLLMSLLPAVCLSQVLNGSFEINEQPSLENWVIVCEGKSFQDAPTGGGMWSLGLPPGNFQGCFPGSADQALPEFRDGDIWEVRVWAKQDEKKSLQTSLYLKIFRKTNVVTILSTDTTTSTQWTQLSVTDTLFLDEGDSVAIILDAGATSGPEVVDHNSYFDLVTAEKIGEIITGVDDFIDPTQRKFKLLQNFPNPFNPETRISFSIVEESQVVINIFNLKGQLIRTLLNEFKSPGLYSTQWDGKSVSGVLAPSGIYYYQLKAGDFLETRKMLFLK